MLATEWKKRIMDFEQEAINSLDDFEIEGPRSRFTFFEFEDGSVLGIFFASSTLFHEEPRVWESKDTLERCFDRPPNERGLLHYAFRLNGKLAPNGGKMQKILGKKISEGETVPLSLVAKKLGIGAVIRILKYSDKTEKETAARLIEKLGEALAQKIGQDTKKPGWFDSIGGFLAKAKTIKKYGQGKILKLSWVLTDSEKRFDKKELPDWGKIIREFESENS